MHCALRTGMNEAQRLMRVAAGHEQTGAWVSHCNLHVSCVASRTHEQFLLVFGIQQTPCTLLFPQQGLKTPLCDPQDEL